LFRRVSLFRLTVSDGGLFLYRRLIIAEARHRARLAVSCQGRRQKQAQEKSASSAEAAKPSGGFATLEEHNQERSQETMFSRNIIENIMFLNRAMLDSGLPSRACDSP
jgi:hypothetical protein